MSLKVVVVAFISLLFMKTVRSQSDELLIQGQTGKLYLQHTVVAKENWYRIGRLYNLPPKELATYNKLDMTKPLSIGQDLQIPLTAGNFSQNGLKAGGETLVPLYHIVQEKEWMYRISVNHNKVSIASLEKWNNINKDQVRAGMHLIVGYLKVKTALSALAKSAGANITATTHAADAAKTPASVKGAGNEKTAGNEKAAGNERAAGNEKLIRKDTMGNSAAAYGTGKTTTPASTTVTTPAKTESETAATNTAVKPVSPTGKSFDGGFFKNEYADGNKSGSGMAATFKSTSGWQDGKYYALMNNIPVGTIVRVTGGTSGKVVYAKVLGQLPDMKESAGLTIRISNAAASELGEGDGKFNVDVRY
ncbi:MAG TPA: LysM peptidoglycan-binding domain-containing protein [Puia sp.]|jgi:LysM repeat protein